MTAVIDFVSGYLIDATRSRHPRLDVLVRAERSLSVAVGHRALSNKSQSPNSTEHSELTRINVPEKNSIREG